MYGGSPIGLSPRALYWLDFSPRLYLLSDIPGGPTVPVAKHILIVRAPGVVGPTHFLTSLSPSWGMAWLSPPLRASNEHCFTVRVLRAQGGSPGHPLSPLTALSAGSYNHLTFLDTTR